MFFTLSTCYFDLLSLASGRVFCEKIISMKKLIEKHKRYKRKYPACLVVIGTDDKYITFGEDAMLLSDCTTLEANSKDGMFYIDMNRTYFNQMVLPKLKSFNIKVSIIDDLEENMKFHNPEKNIVNFKKDLKNGVNKIKNLIVKSLNQNNLNIRVIDGGTFNVNDENFSASGSFMINHGGKNDMYCKISYLSFAESLTFVSDVILNISKDDYDKIAGDGSFERFIKLLTKVINEYILYMENETINIIKNGNE